MGGAQTAEVPALHRAGEALAQRGAGDVDELAGDEMVGGDLRADGDQVVLGDAELGELQLGLDLGLGEAAALGLGDVLHLGAADAELKSGVAVLLLRAVGDDLKAVELQNRDRHMFPAVREDAGHADLLCDDA